MNSAMKTFSIFFVFLLVFKANASEVSSNTSPVVAQILDKKITAGEIGLKYDTNKMPIISENSASSSALNDPVGGLYNLVMIEVMSDYAERNRLKATDEEIRELKNYQNQFMSKEKIENQKMLEETEMRLKDTTLSPTEREKAEKRRTNLLTFARNAKHAVEMRQSTEEELRSVYGPWIEAWKFNKSIYDKYGGKVAITKFGPVPTGAKKDVLSQYEKDGKLLIFDEGLKSNFWSRVAEPPHIEAKPQQIDFTPYWKNPLPKDEN